MANGAAKSVGRSRESGGPKESGAPMASDSPVRSSEAPRRIDDAVADAIGSVDNAPSLGMHHAGISIDGYSRAAVQTYWRIAELKIGFDLGAQPWDFMALPRYFITHSHLDHIAALPAYVARRRMMKMEQPTIYLPDYAVATVDQLLKVFSRLDRGRLPCTLVPITPHQEIEISRELVVTTYPMRHSIPALGFIVWERRKKLKPEFSHLTGDQIRDIKLSGTDVTHEIRIPLIAYTGDTAPPGLDDNPDMYRAKILITEMTFVAPEHRKEKIHKHGHMHLDDFVQRRNDFKNELIICGHFSVRYNEQQIRRWIDRALPDRLDGRLKVWL
jgi:ribonuclease Z